MKIVIVGAGAMGSTFGGLLHEAGEDVYLLDIWAEHMQAINRDGLWLEGVSGDRSIPLKAFTQSGQIGPADLIIIFVKAPHTQSAARGMEPLMKDETIVLTLQNGLGNQEAIEGVLGKGRILIGITSAGAFLIGPGRVQHTGWGDIYLGEPEGPVSPRAQSVAEVLSNTGLSAQPSNNAQGFVWTKLLINAALNAPAALMRVRNGEIAGNEACRSFALKVLDECVRVAKTKGIMLVYPDMKEEFLAICQKTASNLNSMYQDILAKRQTEIDYINGALVREGETLGVEVPLNRAITGLMKGLEATSSVRAD